MKALVRNDFGAIGVAVIDDLTMRVESISVIESDVGNYEAGNLNHIVGKTPAYKQAEEPAVWLYDWCDRRAESSCDEACGGSLCLHRGHMVTAMLEL
jgi:hypothetical protein